MKKPSRDSPYALATTMTQLALASWETIFRRSLMMAQGTCSKAEYQLMSEEKLAATQIAMAALAGGRGPAAIVAPFVTRARANAKRLRRDA